MSDLIKICDNLLKDCDIEKLIRILHQYKYLNNSLQDKDFDFTTSLNLSSPKLGIKKTAFITQGTQSKKLEITLDFLSIVGPNGILPVHYTSLLINAKKDKDKLLVGFIDILYSKLMKFFLNLTVRYSWVLSCEQQIISNNKEKNKNWSLMSSLLGVTDDPRNQILSGYLLNNISLLLSGSRSAWVLETILSRSLSIPIKVEQFVLERLKLDQVQLSKLGIQNTILGNSLYLGHYAEFYQSRVIIKFFNLTLKGYNEYYYGLSLRIQLEKFLDYYLGMGIKYTFEFFVIESEKKTTLNACIPRRLGFNIWLKV